MYSQIINLCVLVLFLGVIIINKTLGFLLFRIYFDFYGDNKFLVLPKNLDIPK